MSRRSRRRKQPSQRKADARRRQSPSQREPIKPDLGTKELQLHRRNAAGFTLNLKVPFDEALPMEFPLAIMKARGVISTSLHDAGMRFGALAWSLYGEPFAGCEALYERMLASTDRGPRLEPDPGDAHDRQKARANLHAMMLSALQRSDPELSQPIESGRMRRLIVDVCQHCRSPRWLVLQIDGVLDGNGKMRYRLSDGIERGLLMEGLGRLANLERQQTPRRSAA